MLDKIKSSFPYPNPSSTISSFFDGIWYSLIWTHSNFGLIVVVFTVQAKVFRYSFVKFGIINKQTASNKHFEFLVRFFFAILFLREKRKKKWCFVWAKKTVEQLQSFTLIKGIIQCLKAGVPLSSTNFVHKFKILDFLNSESLLDVSCMRSYSWTLVMVWTTSHKHNSRTFWGQK